MKFESFVSGRYLRAKRKQAFIGVISTITLIGITLGVAALNIALAIHNGMQRAWMQSLVGKTGELYILADQFDSDGFDSQELTDLATMLSTLPQIEAVSYERQEAGLLVARTPGNRPRVAFSRVKGIVPDDFSRASDRLSKLVAGTVEGLQALEGQRPGVVLGVDLAEKLGAQVGEYVKFIVPRIASPGLSMRNQSLREIKLKVVGIFRTGNTQFDEFEAYVLLDTLMTFTGQTGIQSVFVKLKHVDQLNEVKQALRSDPRLPVLTRVFDLLEYNQSILHALALEKRATTLVIGLIILIVGLNMVSALIMLVMEKHRDIGIMKAMGASRSMILRIFVRQGMSLSLIGTFCGTVLGVGGSILADETQLISMDNQVYEVLSYLPFQVRPQEVAWVALGSLIISFVACYYPARQAAMLDPVEALKYD